MKIKIITDRKVWVNDAPQLEGAEIDVSAENGAALVELGFAEVVKVAKARTKVAEE